MPDTGNTYLVLDGRTVSLPEDMVANIKKELDRRHDESDRKNPFWTLDELNKSKEYYDIAYPEEGAHRYYPDDEEYVRELRYVKNKAFARQLYLRQLLDRKLLKYAIEHDALSDKEVAFSIVLSLRESGVIITVFTSRQLGGIGFSDKVVANAAIKDVVEPFMKQYPDFDYLMGYGGKRDE